ncbi:MAG: 7-cyano-7-deazaguanine reductase [Actinomycetota bacterium]|nr:7-cyano-7-deazaguanine reductase [Actinomycetota bacterium]
MTSPKRALETFPAPEHVETVKFASDELTSLCPLTGQPDFNSVEILYAPDQRCVESKSLKLYLWSFRDEGAFVETLASTIAGDVFDSTAAYWVEVTILQHVRGGIVTTAVARRERAPSA